MVSLDFILIQSVGTEGRVHPSSVGPPV